MNRQLRSRIYDSVRESGAGAPDPSLLEMSRALGVGYGALRITIMRMERRGIVRRIYRGIYRPVERSALDTDIAGGVTQSKEGRYRA